MSSSTVWASDNAQSGACPGTPHPMPSPEQNLWTRQGPDISLDLRQETNAQKCMSWSTQDSCEFPMADLEELQVDLQSKDCEGLWTAPLWIAPRPGRWRPPQHATGEIDIFERGCSREDGYLLSYGENDPYIIHNAWLQQNQPQDDTHLRAYIKFDMDKDVITTYSCALDRSPIHTGDLTDCGITSTHHGYFRDTADQTDNQREPMNFVSDIWNKEGLPCGSAVESSNCAFSISNLQMKFSRHPTEACQDCAWNEEVCNSLLASDSADNSSGSLSQFWTQEAEQLLSYLRNNPPLVVFVVATTIIGLVFFARGQ